MTNENDVVMIVARGDEFRNAGRFDDALNAYRQLLRIPEAMAQGYFKCGTVYDRSGRDVEAEQAYHAALAADPGYNDARNNLALACVRKRLYIDAEMHYREILANQTDFLNAHINLGNLLIDLGRLPEAIYLLRRAVSLGPDNATAHDRLGVALRSAGRVREGAKWIGRAVELNPEMEPAWNNLGACYFNLGEHDLADEAFSRAIDISGDSSNAWHNWVFLSNFRSFGREEIFARHLRYGEALSRRLGLPPLDHLRHDYAPERRLRIGFVSGDLRRHSVAYFLLAAVRYLDRNAFELAAYSNSPFSDDGMTELLRPNFVRWRDLSGMSDADAAARIQRDNIDILIDLAGHTPYNRLDLFGMRPAPVQMSWIGYPNTTGVDGVDYRVTDATVDPDGDDLSVERLLRLPRPFLCYTPPQEAAEVGDLPFTRNGFVTFGSFNARVKLGDECISIWSRALSAVPGSRLLLKSVLGLDEPESKAVLIGKFLAHGIAPDRLEILGTDNDIGDHLATYGRIDIALDAYPYNGTTTSCEALWMGVPMVTLRGDRHASRVGHALLSYLSLHELSASDADEFVLIVRELAADIGRLTDLRRTMRQRMEASALLDGPGMGADLGAALRQAWLECCADAVGRQSDLAECGLPGEELIRLHIGGEIAQDGWMNLNTVPGEFVDFVGDVSDLSGFAEESCQEIYASHVLEHVPQGQIIETLRGLHRILAPGGKLYLSVPDMEVLTWLFNRPDFDKHHRLWIMRLLFGSQTDPHDFHFIGLTFEFMVDYLSLAGFSSVEQVESFGLFEDTSNYEYAGVRISLNLVAEK